MHISSVKLSKVKAINLFFWTLWIDAPKSFLPSFLARWTCSTNHVPWYPIFFLWICTKNIEQCKEKVMLVYPKILVLLNFFSMDVNCVAGTVNRSVVFYHLILIFLQTALTPAPKYSAPFAVPTWRPSATPVYSGGLHAGRGVTSQSGTQFCLLAGMCFEEREREREMACRVGERNKKRDREMPSKVVRQQLPTNETINLQAKAFLFVTPRIY